MRARTWSSIALLALLATCQGEGAGDVGLPAHDGGYGGAPGRNVVDPPDGLFAAGSADVFTPPVGSQPIGGGGSGGTDGSTAPRADARLPDRPADRVAGTSCNLVLQDCGAARGCYPPAIGSGNAECSGAGSLDESAPCVEHDACAPGFLCVDTFGGGGSRLCEPVCDPSATYPCPAGRTCQRYAGGAAGYCEP